jgi:hypothetical protein
MRRFRCVGLAVMQRASHRDAIAPLESPGGIRFEALSIRPRSMPGPDSGHLRIDVTENKALATTSVQQT